MSKDHPESIEIKRISAQLKAFRKLETSTASACSAIRGYETSLVGTTLTMKFKTRDHGREFFDWLMSHTQHEQNGGNDAAEGRNP